MLSRLLRFLLLLVVVRLVFRFLAGLLRGRETRVPPGSPQAHDLVRDPVCQTHVPRDRAVRGTSEGNEAFFCSVACRDRAQAMATATSR
jgi:YHS domain-containing protein